MSNFKQNTVETVGDAALAESIIDRSITELHCNNTTSIAAHKFRGCSGLTNVIFPNASSVGTGAFWQCAALKQADFSACVAFAQDAFYGCSALEALILRNEEAVSSIIGTLYGTGIADGTGYIYVPSALVDTYKAASGWSTYAAQIRAIEDHPAVCSKYSWDGVFAAIDAGTYATDYAVGDMIPLDLGSEGVVNMQIVAFDADDKADGSGKAPISWISKELLATAHIMNPAVVTLDDGTYQEGTGGIGGWEKCTMRTYLNDTIKPLIPEDVRGRLVTVTKNQQSLNTAAAKEAQTTSDDIWIPSKYEIFGDKLTGETADMPKYTGLFTVSSVRIKKKTGNSSASEWWMRSANNYRTFHGTSTRGYSVGTNVTTSEYGIALGFCT